MLSKVYRAVDMGVFEDLAQLSVAACAESLKVMRWLTWFSHSLIAVVGSLMGHRVFRRSGTLEKQRLNYDFSTKISKTGIVY